MNQEPDEKILEEQQKLEAATSRQLPSDGELDPKLDAETAELRDAWLAFSKMLEKASPADSHQLALVENKKIKPQSTKYFNILAATLALAATVLVCVAVAWYYVVRLQQHDDGFKPLPIVENEVPTEEPRIALPAETEYEWDDSLDEEISLASEEILEMQKNWLDLGEPFRAADFELEQLEAKFEQEKL